jgi:large subunit ribosomal protein L15
MTTLHTLKAPHRSTHRKKRVGRGQGSGLGKTAGRGGKGQKARSGNMRFEGFEGGQSPLQRRLPKFGFNSPNRKEFAVVNLADLAELEGEITPELLAETGRVRRGRMVKVLGDGEITRALTVKAHAFSASAREKIEAAGGTVEEIER